MDADGSFPTTSLKIMMAGFVLMGLVEAVDVLRGAFCRLLQTWRSGRADASALRRWRGLLSPLVGIAGWPLVFVTHFFITGQWGVGAGLDASWQQVVEHAAARHWQFGTEIIYTLGPLGFLETTWGLGGFVVVRILAAWGTALFFANLIFRVAEDAPWGARLALLGSPILINLALNYEREFLVAAAFMILMSSRRGKMVLFESLYFALGLALFALIKFTVLMSAALGLAVFACHLLLRRATWRQAIALPGALLCFLVGWIALGQNIANLPAYLRNSFEIAVGYNAMLSKPDPSVLTVGVMVAAGLCLCALITLTAAWRGRDRWSVLLQLGALLGIAFMKWKHGFTRADHHVLQFFSMAFPFAFLMCGVIRQDDQGAEGKTHRGWRWVTPGVLLVLSLLGTKWDYATRGFPPYKASDKLSLLYHRLVQAPGQLGASLSPSFHLAGVDDLPADRREAMLLPQSFRQRMGLQSVDLIDWDQNRLFVSGLHYRPRPVFQSYAAYTPRLQRINLEHCHGPLGPDFMVFTPSVLDDRLLWLDDAPLLLHLLTHYEMEQCQDNLLLLKRPPDDRASGHWETLESGEKSWGHAIEVPALEKGYCAVRVKAPRSAWGKIKRLLYQGAAATIRVKLDNHHHVSQRFIPEMAEDGVLLSPWMQRAEDIFAWQKGGERPPQVLTFRLDPMEGCATEFADKFQYTLMRWVPSPGEK